MTWGGLRGAVGLALAIQVRSEKAGGGTSMLLLTQTPVSLLYQEGSVTLGFADGVLDCRVRRNK
eukprot:3322055-Amphidinium_carterae.1